MQIEVRNLGFFYYGINNACKSAAMKNWLFRNISLIFNETSRTALLGPSGCGKTTFAKIIANYLLPCEGAVLIDGNPYNPCKIKKLCWQPVQLIAQHPEKAFNPRLLLRDSLYECYPEGLNIDFLNKLGIEASWLNRYPRELSGGELQRFCIARVLANGTRFIIADEISSMFDVVTQAQIWNILIDECNVRKIGLIAITHDTSLASVISNEKLYFNDIQHN